MKSWKTRLLMGLMLVATMLATVAGPAIADHRDDCRKFNGDRYCEVDRFDRHDRIDYEVFYYPYYFSSPFYFYPYYYNDCGFDWDGPVTPYDCFD